jgi:hypothetical protein
MNNAPETLTTILSTERRVVSIITRDMTAQPTATTTIAPIAHLLAVSARGARIERVSSASLVTRILECRIATLPGRLGSDHSPDGARVTPGGEGCVDVARVLEPPRVIALRRSLSTERMGANALRKIAPLIERC